ncbi:type I methionyl aminopeptidase [Epibacterium sp. MM17-32]|uniref:type I methionyl aminopeptidase n=1 Tax=Epibacterium sp. MM17-32 TaxID=2917734 RepID=UPI001EF4EB44|nr:type I methionyl aminopeptidase [Epibacterium sp. MM17-32]MCG7629419.1 type I methionyl aminopeptidase [Epibacterium sp. MM17-32]
MVKSPQELTLMRQSGRLLASVFDMLDQMPLLGRSTLEINDRVERFIEQELQARPASKGQYGFEYVLNCSRNHVVCHGVPSASEVITDGDIINLDITLEKNGYIADSSKTYLVGNVSGAARRLVRIAYGAMWQGIAQVRPGGRMGDVGHAIERYARRHACSVVREYCGHGIGRQMHEAPQVLNFGRPGTGERLRAGMVFTVEPMVNLGSRRVETEPDGWTIVTRDRRLSAQFEHTVAVTDAGVEVLTLRRGERPAGQPLRA